MTKKQINLAVQDLKSELQKMFGDDIELRIFGSAVRGDYKRHSDIDVLVLLSGRVDNAIEEKVFDAAYDIELKHGVVFGIIVYGKEFWGSEVAASMPLYPIRSKDNPDYPLELYPSWR
jgi:predicted nucleotidyltransferase